MPGRVDLGMSGEGASSSLVPATTVTQPKDLTMFPHQ